MPVPSLRGPFPPTWLASSQGVAPTSRYSRYLLSLGPALYWRLGESGATAADSSGNGRTGTYQANVVQQVAGGVYGDADGAVALANASDSYVSGTYQPWTAGGVRTVTGLFNLTAFSSNDKLLIAGFASTPSIIWPALYANPASDVLLIDDLNVPTANVTWSAAWPATAQWVHVALIVDDTAHTAELFIDGVSKGQLSPSFSLAPAANFGVGGISGGWGPKQWNGPVDDVAVFERALTATEISLLAAIARGENVVLPITVVASATVSVSATLTRQAQLVRSLTEAIAPSATRQAQLPRQANVTITATATKRPGVARTVTVALTNTVTRQVQLVRTVTSTITATVVRQVQLVRSVVETIAPSVVRQVRLVRSATVTITPTAVVSKVLIKVANATVTVTATASRQVGVVRSATVTTAASVARKVGVVRSATVSAVASLLRKVGITRSATVTITATKTTVVPPPADLWTADRAVTVLDVTDQAACTLSAADAAVARLEVRDEAL